MKTVIYFSLFLCGLNTGYIAAAVSGFDELNDSFGRTHMACDMLDAESSQDEQLYCASRIIECYAKLWKVYKEKHDKV